MRRVRTLASERHCWMASTDSGSQACIQDTRAGGGLLLSRFHAQCFFTKPGLVSRPTDEQRSIDPTARDTEHHSSLGCNGWSSVSNGQSSGKQSVWYRLCAGSGICFARHDRAKRSSSGSTARPIVNLQVASLENDGIPFVALRRWLIVGVLSLTDAGSREVSWEFLAHAAVPWSSTMSLFAARCNAMP
jgi:hypothetical protein